MRSRTPSSHLTVTARRPTNENRQLGPVGSVGLTALSLLLLTTVASAGDLIAEDARGLSAEDVKHRVSHRLDGYHFTARVRFEIKKSGYEERRELDVWRDDQGGVRERLMALFQEPAYLRGLALLYIEGGRSPNSYFVFQPSSQRVRRVPESAVSQNIYGVDLEYMGFGVAELQPVEVVSMKIERLDGREVYRLTERAIDSDQQRFDERRIWIDPETFVPVRTEHLRKGKTTLIASTLVLKEVGGVPTPVETVYQRPEDGVEAHMTVVSIDYEAPIPEVFFSTLQLTKGR
jgi:hypothetical protein